MLDCRGVEITGGCKVVAANAFGRLREETVRELERPGEPHWWVNVRFMSGGYTTPDRVAVVPELLDNGDGRADSDGLI